jgi:hypothetical protein
MTSRVRVKQVATLMLPQSRDASFASGGSEPTAGDKRRVLDAGGFHSDEDGIEASSNLHTRRRRVLQDESDQPTMQEEISHVMSFPSLREILAGNSETNGLAQSVSLTKPGKDALMMQPLEPEEAEFLVFLQNVAQNSPSMQNVQNAQQADRLFLPWKIEEILINMMEKARAKPGEKIWCLVGGQTRGFRARIKAAFFACLQNAAQNAQKAAEIAALNNKSYNSVGGNRTRGIQPIASAGSAFTMWEPREGQIPKPQVIQECRTFSSVLAFCGTTDCAPEPSGRTDVSSDSNVAGGMSDEEIIANLAGCAAPTGVRLADITAGERESESESESDGNDDGERAETRC